MSSQKLEDHQRTQEAQKKAAPKEVRKWFELKSSTSSGMWIYEHFLAEINFEHQALKPLCNLAYKKKMKSNLVFDKQIVEQKTITVKNNLPENFRMKSIAEHSR